jgi:hypothetical protein
LLKMKPVSDLHKMSSCPLPETTAQNPERIRLALAGLPLWLLAACSSGEGISVAPPSPAPAPSPGAPAAPAPAPLPTTASAQQDMSAASTVSTNIDIAVHSNGDALVVWQQRSTAGGSTDQAHALRYSYASNSWDATSTRLDGSANSQSIFQPRIAMDQNGNAVVAWTQASGAYSVRLNSSTGVWSSPVQLSNNADDLCIASDRATPGTALVVWHNGGGLFSRLYNFAADSWAAQETITSVGNHPAMGMDAQGRAILTWFVTGPPFEIRAARYVNGWGGLIVIDATNVSDYPAISVNATGDAVVVWEGSNGVSGLGIWAARFLASSAAWSAALLISTNTSGNSGTAVPRMNAAGNAIVLWHQGSVGNFTARYTASSSTWAAPQQVNINAFDGSIVLNNLNQAAALWERWTDSQIYSATQTDPALAWSAAQVLQTGAEASAGAQSGISTSGHVIVWAWLQRIGGNYRVQTRVVR